MRLQVQSNAISGRRFRRAPSRCQMFWQGILILATLALAVAANAEPLQCDGLLRPTGVEEFFKPNQRALIRYSVTAHPGRLVEPDQQERQNIVSAIDSTKKVKAQDLTEKQVLLAKLEQKRSTTAREYQMQVLRSEISFEQSQLQVLDEMKKGLVTKQRLTIPEMQMLYGYNFEEYLPFTGKADLQKVTERMAELQANSFQVTKSVTPPTTKQRLIKLMWNNKMVTIGVGVALLGGLGTVGDLYLSHHESRPQPVLVYE